MAKAFLSICLTSKSCFPLTDSDPAHFTKRFLSATCYVKMPCLSFYQGPSPFSKLDSKALSLQSLYQLIDYLILFLYPLNRKLLWFDQYISRYSLDGSSLEMFVASSCKISKESIPKLTVIWHCYDNQFPNQWAYLLSFLFHFCYNSPSLYFTEELVYHRLEIFIIQWSYTIDSLRSIDPDQRLASSGP